MNNSIYNFKYIPAIDGLRAIAVLSVILFHLDASFLPGGFTGVDVFFVISGYVVSASLAANFVKNNYINSNKKIGSFFTFLTAFYARRIRRIFPALVVCLLVSSLLTAMFIPFSWNDNIIGKVGTWAFFGLGNIALVKFTDGYFSMDAEYNPFTHTWSLGVEEQFYVIFPLVFFIFLASKTYKQKFLGFILLVILALTSLIFSAYETINNFNKAFYLLPSRFWELAVGAMLFQLHFRCSNNYKNSNGNFSMRLSFLFSKKVILLAFLTGLLLIIYSFIFVNKLNFPFPNAIFSVLGSAFIIHAITNTNIQKYKLLNNIFDNNLMVYIGKISFSLYLWHWAIYVLFRWTIGLDSIALYCIAVVLTFIFAILSYKFVELPIKKGAGNNIFGLKFINLKTVSIGVFIISISCFISNYVLIEHKEKFSLSQTKNTEFWFPSDEIISFENEAIKQSKKYDFSNKRLFIVGDSHTGSLQTLVAMLRKHNKMDVNLLTIPGCPVWDLRTDINHFPKHCKIDLNGIYNKLLTDVKKGDIVFFSSLRGGRLTDKFTAFDREQLEKYFSKYNIQTKQIYTQLRNEFVPLANQLVKKKAKVILNTPSPVFATLAIRCADWFSINSKTCKNNMFISKHYLTEFNQQMLSSLNTLKTTIPAITIWNIFDILCISPNFGEHKDDKNYCSLFDKNNMPIFHDTDHLSAYGNTILYPHFTELLNSIYSENNSNNK